MAFAGKFGSLLRQTLSTRSSNSTAVPAVFNALRFMSSSRLFVGGLSYGMDDESLREAFTEFGDLTEARIIHDRESGRSRGFGFISFSTSQEADAARTGMDGKQLHGRIIRVDYASERPTGFRASASGYGGGYGGSYGGNSGYNQSGGYGGNPGYNQTGGYGGNVGYDQSRGGGYEGNARYDQNAGNDGFRQNGGYGESSRYGYDQDQGTMSTHNQTGENSEEAHAYNENDNVNSMGKGY